MSWKITIGAYRLGMLDSVDIVRSVELLSDTAEIKLPAFIYNQPLNFNGLIKRGDAVKVELGYNDKLVTEFEGYLEQEPITDGGTLILKCEDNLFLYRKDLKDTVLKNPTVADIINHVHRELGLTYKLKCDYSYKYDKFTIYNATGYDVLKKIQEDTKPNIYLKGNELHVHPPYSEISGTAKYDFAINIEKADLKYKRAEDRKVKINIEYKGTDGKLHRYEMGDTGGEVVNRKSSTNDSDSLKQQAKNEYVSRTYTGYEGTFTGWLVPYCDAGYQVRIHDDDYEYKTGNYYVTEVKTTFAKEGGSRTIKLGKKLSDG